MKMTKKEKKASKESIQHWEIDIVKRFKDGDSIGGANWEWKSDREIVKHGESSCALCRLMDERGISGCGNCIYLRFYGEVCCNGGTWTRFDKNPCLETAKAMLNKLKAIK